MEGQNTPALTASSKERLRVLVVAIVAIIVVPVPM